MINFGQFLHMKIQKRQCPGSALVCLVLCLYNVRLGIARPINPGQLTWISSEDNWTPFRPAFHFTNEYGSERKGSLSKPVIDARLNTRGRQDGLLLGPVTSESNFKFHGTSQGPDHQIPRIPFTHNDDYTNGNIPYKFHRDRETGYTFEDYYYLKKNINDRLNLDAQDETSKHETIKKLILDQGNVPINARDFKLLVERKPIFQFDDYLRNGDENSRDYFIQPAKKNVNENSSRNGDDKERSLEIAYIPPVVSENAATGFFEGQPIRKFDGTVDGSANEESLDYIYVDSKDSKVSRTFDSFLKPFRVAPSRTTSFSSNPHPWEKDQSLVPYSPPDKSYVQGAIRTSHPPHQVNDGHVEVGHNADSDAVAARHSTLTETVGNADVVYPNHSYDYIDDKSFPEGPLDLNTPSDAESNNSNQEYRDQAVTSITLNRLRTLTSIIQGTTGNAAAVPATTESSNKTTKISASTEFSVETTATESSEVNALMFTTAESSDSTISVTSSTEYPESIATTTTLSSVASNRATTTSTEASSVVPGLGDLPQDPTQEEPKNNTKPSPKPSSYVKSLLTGMLLRRTSK